jgi:hypothetical protein
MILVITRLNSSVSWTKFSISLTYIICPCLSKCSYFVLKVHSSLFFLHCYFILLITNPFNFPITFFYLTFSLLSTRYHLEYVILALCFIRSLYILSISFFNISIYIFTTFSGNFILKICSVMEN